MADQVPVFVHEYSGRYYYDTEVNNKFGWSGGKVAFRAYATPEPGTVPIYCHAPQKYQTYYYDKQLHATDGWQDGTVAFHAYYKPQDGTIPIYEHKAEGGERPRFFYDTQLKNIWGWSEGVPAFYAYPPAPTLIDDIAGVLGEKGVNYYGITYSVTGDNQFTLLDTPQLWDSSATVTQPIQACERLLHEIQSTISSAKDIVDITLLWQTDPKFKNLPFLTGLPLGGFQHAIFAGLKGLIQANSKALVRILIGVPLPIVVADLDLRNWLKATIELDNKQKLTDVRFQILIGCHKNSGESWNHAKIVAADSKRAVVGGHNQWATDYLGAHPVHDVSGLIQGSAVGCVQNFCSNLWTSPASLPVPQMLENGKFHAFTKSTTIPPPPSESKEKRTRMLSLGRLGFSTANKFSVTSNASVTARLIALCRAKHTIRISQQSLYFNVIGLVPGFDFYTLWALVKAMQAGVNVQIVVSNEVPVADGGYDGYLSVVVKALTSLYVGDRLDIIRASKKPARDDMGKWAEASQESAPKELPLIAFRTPTPAQCQRYLDELNGRLSVAPLYYAPNINYWQVGGERHLAANHAKVYIIDDTHFYVGSDNLYLSATEHGLQEFGHLIEGKKETADFIKNYWDKLWKNSAPHAVRASYTNLSYFVHMPPRR